MFKRTILDKLDLWSRQEDHKPLVLRGARQVGKTTAVESWASRMDQYLYLNLERLEDRHLFEQELSFQNRLEAIFFSRNLSPQNGRTLIFLDEIQNVPQAVAELRYFYEEAKGLFVIAAGSLLESLMGRHISFPVGRVQYLVLRPLSFSEFLGALGEERALEALSQIPVPAFAHSTLNQLFHRFALIGGMPEIVKIYRETGDLTRLKSIYESLIAAYLDDVEKYATNAAQANVIRHIIRNAFYEAGSRITFEGFGRSKYKSREISDAFALLEKAMLLYLIYPTTNCSAPGLPDRKKSPKLQLLDTGLVNYFAGMQAELLQTQHLDHIFQGKIAEHIVGQELLAARDSVLHGLQFWVREKKQSNAKVDFVVQHDQWLIPVEVKSGAVGRLRSLHQFIDQAPHPYAVRVCDDALRIDSVRTVKGKPFFLLNLPYYLVGQLDIYLDWFITQTR